MIPDGDALLARAAQVGRAATGPERSGPATGPAGRRRAAAGPASLSQRRRVPGRHRRLAVTVAAA